MCSILVTPYGGRGVTEVFNLLAQEPKKAARIRRGGWSWGPVERAKLRVLSMGAGVPSTTLALMAAHGEIGPMPARSLPIPVLNRHPSMSKSNGFNPATSCRSPYRFDRHLKLAALRTMSALALTFP